MVTSLVPPQRFDAAVVTIAMGVGEDGQALLSRAWEEVLG